MSRPKIRNVRVSEANLQGEARMRVQFVRETATKVLGCAGRVRTVRSIS